MKNQRTPAARMARAVCIDCVLALFAVSNSALAARPCCTEDAGVAGDGTITAEFCLNYAAWADGSDESMFLMVAGYGITPRLELSFEIPVQSGSSRYGVGDVCIAGKYMMWEQGKQNPMLAVKSTIKTASGDAERGLGSGAVDYTMVAAASYERPRWSAHTFAGATFADNNGTEHTRDTWIWGLAADVAISKRWHTVAEATGHKNPLAESEADEYAVLAGLTAAHGSMLIWDAGLRLGLSDAVPQWGMTLGCSLTF